MPDLQCSANAHMSNYNDLYVSHIPSWHAGLHPSTQLQVTVVVFISCYNCGNVTKSQPAYNPSP